MPGVLSGDFFGYPAWYVDGILFACLEGDGIAFRLERKDAGKWLLEPGVRPFSLFGGKFRMSEWVQVLGNRIDCTESGVAIRESAYEYAIRRAKLI